MRRGDGKRALEEDREVVKWMRTETERVCVYVSAYDEDGERQRPYDDDAVYARATFLFAISKISSPGKMPSDSALQPAMKR